MYICNIYLCVCVCVCLCVRVMKEDVYHVLRFHETTFMKQEQCIWVKQFHETRTFMKQELWVKQLS